MNTATLILYVSILTGYPVPDQTVKWAEMPLEVIVDVACRMGHTDCFSKRNLYFETPGCLGPGVVWYAPGWRDRLAAHEVTHHLQMCAGADYATNRDLLEKQAECVEQFHLERNKPILNYCKIGMLK